MTWESKLDRDIQTVRQQFGPGGQPVAKYRELGMGQVDYPARVGAQHASETHWPLAQLTADIMADAERRLVLVEEFIAQLKKSYDINGL